MRLILLLWSAIASAVLVGAEPELIRREVPWGRAISLEEFGAPRIEIAVKTRQISYVAVEIADYTQMVPVVVGDTYSAFGQRVTMQPARELRRIEKKDGVRFPGSRSDMYFLFREPMSGVEVYFLDEAAGQNKDFLVVAVPPHPAPPGAAPAAEPEPIAEAPLRTRAKIDILSPELLEWYSHLQEARLALDLKDPAAVKEFNAEAARYHAAVRKARARTKE